MVILINEGQFKEITLYIYFLIKLPYNINFWSKYFYFITNKKQKKTSVSQIHNTMIPQLVSTIMCTT